MAVIDVLSLASDEDVKRNSVSYILNEFGDVYELDTIRGSNLELATMVLLGVGGLLLMKRKK